PDDDGEALALRLLGEPAELRVHLVPERRARVDREPDRRAAEAERLVDAPGDRGRGLALRERVRVVELQDERDLARELRGARLEEAERGGVGVAAGLDRELEVVARIVGGGVRRERTRRPVLESLVDREDDELARSAEPPVIQEPGEVRLRSGVVAAVPAENLAHSLVHCLLPPLDRRNVLALTPADSRSGPARSRGARSPRPARRGRRSPPGRAPRRRPSGSPPGRAPRRNARTRGPRAPRRRGGRASRRRARSARSGRGENPPRARAPPQPRASSGASPRAASSRTMCAWCVA